ncbi:hypothetical protein AVEN_168850-1 [Araneus ventricosus]|uniref:Uncharacterized protein n=1 Tax=Araneus ventricosus TaxID=182803 RepID=A0A4Y2UN18_ARAVE|nr:hypothetical protein AVEN_168850-1 [Araneus ventricosus]
MLYQSLRPSPSPTSSVKYASQVFPTPRTYSHRVDGQQTKRRNGYWDKLDIQPFASYYADCDRFFMLTIGFGVERSSLRGFEWS